MVPSIKQRTEDINDLVKEFLSSSLNFHKMNIENVSNDAILFFSELVCVIILHNWKNLLSGVSLCFWNKNEKITKERLLIYLMVF